METKEETCIYSGSRYSVEDYYSNVAYIVEDFTELLELDLLTGKISVLCKEDIICSCHSDGDRIVLLTKDSDSGDYVFKYIDLKTGKINAIKQRSVILGINAIFEDKLYVSFGENEQFCTGYISKKDFYNNRHDKVVPLIYPNK